MTGTENRSLAAAQAADACKTICEDMLDNGLDVLSLIDLRRAARRLSAHQPPLPARLVLFVPPSAVKRFQEFWGPSVDVRPYEDLHG